MSLQISRDLEIDEISRKHPVIAPLDELHADRDSYCSTIRKPVAVEDGTLHQLISECPSMAGSRVRTYRVLRLELEDGFSVKVDGSVDQKPDFIHGESTLTIDGGNARMDGKVYELDFRMLQSV